jgi:hypothetical protein
MGITGYAGPYSTGPTGPEGPEGPTGPAGTATITPYDATQWTYQGTHTTTPTSGKFSNDTSNIYINIQDTSFTDNTYWLQNITTGGTITIYLTASINSIITVTGNATLSGSVYTIPYSGTFPTLSMPTIYVISYNGGVTPDPLNISSLYVSSIQSFNAVDIPNTLAVQQVQTNVIPSYGPSGTVNYDWSGSDVFYISGIASGNWTANIVNLPTITNKAFGVVFILRQDGTPYYIDTLQINSSAQTIMWPNATAPTPVAYTRGVESFTLYYDSAWTVIGTYTSFA